MLRVIRKVPRGLKECSENLTPSSGQQVPQEKWFLGSRILASPLLNNNTRRSTSPLNQDPLLHGQKGKRARSIKCKLAYMLK